MLKKENILNSENMTLYYVTFFNSPKSPKYSTILGIIKHVSPFELKHKIYILVMFNAAIVSSPPLIVWSSLVWNFLPLLKNELLSIRSKVIDAKTYLSDMDQIFMILALMKLGTKFDNIQEQILTSSTIPTFNDIFARLLHHSSTTTRSRPSKVSNETSVMLSPSHPLGDSRNIRGGHRGRGQRPHCTYCNRPGHIRDKCYQLHGLPPRTTHVA